MNQFTKLSLIVLSALLLAVSACKQDLAPLVIPDSYDGSSFQANAATEIQVADQLGILSSALKAGRDSATTLSSTDLLLDYSTGNPSLASLTTPYYKSLVEAWLGEAAASSGKGFSFEDAPSQDGGVYVSYLFNGSGIEVEQLIEKGLFAAAMYNHAITLLAGNMTPATVDQLVAIYGANPGFPNSDNSSTQSNPDRFMAKYAARRDPNDGTGIYTTLRDNFIKLKAALEAGVDYQPEADEAKGMIIEYWEKASMATTINYLTTTISTLSASDPSNADIASAMHAYSEAVGFLHGWRTINDGYRLITDDQIDGLLELMKAPAMGDYTAYTLVTDSFNQLPDLQTAIDDLQSIYGFSDAEVASFALNQVSAQGR